MKDFKLYTKFNFAKCVHLSLLSVPEGNLCSSPEGISDFIKPYLQELQENTIIPDYLTLVSIQTIENEEARVHILTFAKNSTEHFDDDDTASITCFECLRDTFEDSIVNEFGSLYTVSIDFNSISTEPLVNDPEVHPDYPSVPVNPITNKLITNLINYLPDYPWYEYISNSNDQFDENLPELINAGNHLISLYINTDDCLIEFSTEQPDPSDNLFYYSFTTAGIYFKVYFD